MLALAIGCGKGHSVVGTWKVENPPSQGDVGFTLNSDGTYKDWSKDPRAKKAIEATGTYRFYDNTLEFTPSRTVLGQPPTKVEIVWVNEDQFTVKGEDRIAVFNRKKE